MSRMVNDFKPDWVIEKILDYIEINSSKINNIACLGLSFKADIDD